MKVGATHGNHLSYVPFLCQSRSRRTAFHCASARDPPTGGVPVTLTTAQVNALTLTWADYAQVVDINPVATGILAGAAASDIQPMTLRERGRFLTRAVFVSTRICQWTLMRTPRVSTGTLRGCPAPFSFAATISRTFCEYSFLPGLSSHPYLEPPDRICGHTYVDDQQPIDEQFPLWADS